MSRPERAVGLQSRALGSRGLCSEAPGSEQGVLRRSPRPLVFVECWHGARRFCFKVKVWCEVGKGDSVTLIQRRSGASLL